MRWPRSSAAVRPGPEATPGADRHAGHGRMRSPGAERLRWGRSLSNRAVTTTSAGASPSSRARAPWSIGHRGIGALLVGALVVTYGSVFVASYGVADDYAQLLVFSAGGEADMRAHYARMFMAQGRPILVLLVPLGLGPLHHISDLRYLRAFSVLCVGLLAWAVWRGLVEAGWSRERSACAALLVCTTPGFQVYAAWAVAAFYPLGAVVAGWACAVTGRALAASRRSHALALGAGATVLETVSLTLYQPAGMFFLVFVAIAIFRPELALREFLRRLAGYSAVLSAGLVAAFAVYRIGQQWYGTLMPADRARLASDLWEKT